jgi:DNA-3-methyladenine glycosylase
MEKFLGRKFFERPAPEVAEDLLGKYLVREINGMRRKFLVTETEAYEGTEDLASHASKGKTKRNEVMFGKAGILYIYLVYGLYEMLNIVTGSVGHPGAVLIRGLKESRKDINGNLIRLDGPGRVTRELKAGRRLNGLPATPETGLWFVQATEGSGTSSANIEKEEIKIIKTSRVGISYAGPVWSKKLWRYILNSVYLDYMAKRAATNTKNKTSRSRKTKKRLAKKHEKLSAKKNKGK